MKKLITTQELWQQFIQKNDSKAFEGLFFGLNSRLIKFCEYYVHNREIAEEIVSDVFVKCWLNRATLENVINPETYLFVCVKNLSLNYNKKHSAVHLVNISDYTTEFVDISSPDIKLEKKELLLKLDKAIETLPLQCKIIFRLVKEDNMKCAAVADILNLSTRTVHTQLFRAMKKLSLLMQEHDSLTGKTYADKFFSFTALVILFYLVV